MRSTSRQLCLLCLGAMVVVATATPAKAQGDAQVVLAQIREHVLYARYDDAVTEAHQLLEREDLSASERNEGLEVLATAHLANRDMEQANPILRELYARDPRHRVADADASPLVQGAFQRAREAAPPQVDVRLSHERPTLTRREAPMIEVSVAQGADAVAEIQLHYRTGDAPRFARLEMGADDGVARGRIPLVGPDDQQQVVEYFITARAPSGYQLAAVGSEGRPLTLTAPADRAVRTSGPTPLGEGPGAVEEEGRSLWWIGLIVGIVAVGAGVGAYFLLRPETPEGSLGQVSLELR